MIRRKMVGNSKTIALGPALITAFLATIGALGQTPPGQAKPQSTVSPAGLEFPVVMRQNVVAGKTPVGTKVRATLEVATLVNGIVVPQDAIFSGEVTESVAKSATGPSRLAICMDSAHWKNKMKADKKQSDKNKSVPTGLALAPRIYLTAWYYPVVLPVKQGSPSLLPDTDQPDIVVGTGRRGRRNSPSQPLPPADANPIPAPGSETSKHRVLMKNIESVRNPDGSITLASKSFNVKLDKTTTYVLASGELAAQSLRR